MAEKSEELKMNQELKKEIREKCKNLKPFLQRGSVERIADSIGISRSICYDVIAGRRWNLKVLEELIKEGNSNKKRAQKALNQLNEMK